MDNHAQVTRWEKFGAWLAEGRKLSGLTQEEVAEITGFSGKTVVSRYERGAPCKPGTAILLGLAIDKLPLETLEAAGFRPHPTLRRKLEHGMRQQPPEQGGLPPENASREAPPTARTNKAKAVGMALAFERILDDPKSNSLQAVSASSAATMYAVLALLEDRE